MNGVLGVEEVLFFVPDVRTAKHWYKELLGGDPYFDDDRYCAFRLAGATVGLHTADAKNAAGVAGQVVR